MDKSSPVRTPPPVAAPVRASRAAVFGRVLSLLLQVPPVAYVVLSGTVPGWVRIWLAVWLSVWLIATVVLAAKAQLEAP